MVSPPDADITCPVMEGAASEGRNVTTLEISPADRPLYRGGPDDSFHFGRLSITRFALPIERSMLPVATAFTSAVTPTYALMLCCSAFAAASLPDSTRTVR